MGDYYTHLGGSEGGRDRLVTNLEEKILDSNSRPESFTPPMSSSSLHGREEWSGCKRVVRWVNGQGHDIDWGDRPEGNLKVGSGGEVPFWETPSHTKGD